MMPNEKQYDRFIFLSTRVIQSAADMIEEIGRIEGIRSARGDYTFMPYHMNDLRKAVAKAQKALRNYDACVAADVEQLTSSAFDAAAEHAETVR